MVVYNVYIQVKWWRFIISTSAQYKMPVNQLIALILIKSKPSINNVSELTPFFFLQSTILSANQSISILHQLPHCRLMENDPLWCSILFHLTANCTGHLSYCLFFDIVPFGLPKQARNTQYVGAYWYLDLTGILIDNMVSMPDVFLEFQWLPIFYLENVRTLPALHKWLKHEHEMLRKHGLKLRWTHYKWRVCGCGQPLYQ